MAGSKLGKRRRGAQAAPEAPPVALSSKVARGGGGFGSKAPRAKRARVEDHGDEDDGDASDGTAAAASSSCSPSSFSSSSGGAAALWSKVLVKVGVCGTWRKFEPDDDDDDVLDMDASDLLEELTDSKIFGGYFKRVEVLGDCKVYVRKGVLAAGQLVPAAAEEADDSKLVELDADMTVRDAAKKAKCKGKRLFIRVRLPGGAAAAPAGLEILRNRSMSAADALAAMHPQWQEFAARLKVTRTRLSKKSVPMLHRPAAAIIGKAAATRLGVTTLLEDAGSKALRLGVFTLPSVPADILDGPKDLMLDEEQKWFHLEQRADISREFLQAMLVRTGAATAVPRPWSPRRVMRNVLGRRPQRPCPMLCAATAREQHHA